MPMRRYATPAATITARAVTSLPSVSAMTRSLPRASSPLARCVNTNRTPKLFASTSQPLKAFEPGLGRVGTQHSVVGGETPHQSRLNRDSGLPIRVHDEQHGGTGREAVGGCSAVLRRSHSLLPVVLCFGAGSRNMPRVSAR